MVGAVRVDVGADHLTTVVDAEDHGARRARDVDRPEVAVVPQEAMHGFGLVHVDTHDLSPVVDLQWSGHDGTREGDVDEPPALRAQEAGRRGALVVVVEADRLAAVVDVDVLVEVAAPGRILQPGETALTVAHEVPDDAVAALVGPEDLPTVVDARGRSPRLAFRRGGHGRSARMIDRGQDSTLCQEAMARCARGRRRRIRRRRRQQQEGEQRQRQRNDGGDCGSRWTKGAHASGFAPARRVDQSSAAVGAQPMGMSLG